MATAFSLRLRLHYKAAHAAGVMPKNHRWVLVITFEEAMETVEDGAKPSVLLGNGFSRAWDNEIFNYANLLEATDFEDRDVEIRQLFDRCGTYDFEAVMRALVSAQKVLESYGGNGALIETIEHDQQLLKEALISAISNTHPSRPNQVTDAQYTIARRYLSRFDQIFTVNYDLLFYWSRNMDALPPEFYSTDDGFRAGCQWRGHGTNQEVHFLHGGFTFLIADRLLRSMLTLGQERALLI